MSTDDLSYRLIFARTLVPFVQANLIATTDDERQEVEGWRQQLASTEYGQTNLFPCSLIRGRPNTPMWGPPDDLAWERAHEYYLNGIRLSATSRTSGRQL